LEEDPKRKVVPCYLFDHLKKFHHFFDIRKIMFVNFEAGALENQIKSKGGEGSPVSLTHRLNARVIASSLCSPRAATPPL
jgi:hypothetical protein